MLAHDDLGAIRDAERCANALAEFERIAREDVPRMRLSDEARSSAKTRGLELESALSVRNLALLGRLLATASLHREESRGAHYRLDFPEANDEKWRVVTRLEKSQGDDIVFHTNPVKARPA